MRFISLFFVSVLIIGCATVETAEDASEQDEISGWKITCKKPYLLSQDCSSLTGAKRVIEIEGFKIKVAGSEDGKTILVMDAKMVSNILTDNPFLLNSKRYSDASKNGYEAVKKVVVGEEVGIERVRAIKSLGNVNGYIVELDRDGYTILKNYSQE